MAITDSNTYPAPRPTKWKLFLRSFIPWQVVRFIVINLRMTVMIAKSHGRHVAPEVPDDG